MIAYTAGKPQQKEGSWTEGSLLPSFAVHGIGGTGG